MSTIQLMIKDVGNESLKDWVIAIYDPATEKHSEDFYFFKSRLGGSDNTNCLLVGSLVKDNQFDEEVRPYLTALCESDTIQVLVGQYMYSKNKDKVDKLVGYLKLIKSYLNHTVGILLYEKWEDEETKWRKVEIITV